jgi:S-adenosylmethionine/arginine decarboxylase-like enzyme
MDGFVWEAAVEGWSVTFVVLEGHLQVTTWKHQLTYINYCKGVVTSCC